MLANNATTQISTPTFFMLCIGKNQKKLNQRISLLNNITPAPHAHPQIHCPLHARMHVLTLQLVLLARLANPAANTACACSCVLSTQPLPV